MKIVKFLFGLIKKFLSNFKIGILNTNVSDKGPKIKKALIAESIFEDLKLKTSDKIYLMILIRAFDTTLGYAEISNKDIMMAASCSNNNTVIDAIKRLEKNKYIKKVENKPGKTCRYKILKHIEYSDGSNSKNDIFFYSECKGIVNNTEYTKGLSIENKDKDALISEESIDRSYVNNILQNIQNEVRTSSEILGEVVDRNNTINQEIHVFLQDKNKIK